MIQPNRRLKATAMMAEAVFIRAVRVQNFLPVPDIGEKIINCISKANIYYVIPKDGRKIKAIFMPPFKWGAVTGDISSRLKGI